MRVRTHRMCVRIRVREVYGKKSCNWYERWRGQRSGGINLERARL